MSAIEYDIMQAQTCPKSWGTKYNGQKYFNPNLGRLFRGSFWGGGWGGGSKNNPPPSSLKLVRIKLEISNLARKYTHICSFRKYTF